MSIRDFLKDKIVSIFIAIIVCSSSFFFMRLSDMGIQYSIYIEMIIVSGFILALTLELVTKYKYYNKVREDFDEIDEKTYIVEMMEKPNSSEAKIMYDILKVQCKYLNDRIAEYDNRYKEYEEYIETWIHEVKTPIATAKLLIENNKDIITLSIAEEIDRIDDYVEQVLYYAKSDSVEKDYKIKKVSLRTMVISEVKKNLRL